MMPAVQRRDADETMRLQAVQALADHPGPEAVMPLVAALGDGSWRVRQAAVSGLIHRGGTIALDAVLAAMRADHRSLSVLNSAIGVLAQSGVDTIGTLTRYLTDPDIELRTCAALTLGAQNQIEAIPALLKALDDPDPNVRYHVIEALGRLRAAQAVDALLAIAESRDFALAFPALDALAAIGDRRIACRLLPLLDDELLHSAVVDAIGHLGDEETVIPLVRLCNTRSMPAAALARSLVRLHDYHETAYRNGSYIADLTHQVMTPEGMQYLLDALPHARGDDLRVLAVVLGWLHGAAVDRSLTHLLGQPELREILIEVLVRKGPRVLDLLIEQLSAGDLQARQDAVLALGKIGNPRAVPALLAVLHGDAELTAGVASALAMIGDRQAYGSLLELISQRDATIRRAAISALNSLGHPQMAADMRDLLEDSRPLVREAAVRIAAYAGYHECSARLLQCCRDDQENVRRAAVESLAHLDDGAGNALVMPALKFALKDPSAAVRAAAVRALGQLDVSTAEPLLHKALHDPSFWVRYYTVRVLGRQPSSQARASLIALAQRDEAMQVRVAAVEMLGVLGGPDALPVLMTLTDVPDPDLARAALIALGTTGLAEALPSLQAALTAADRTRRIDGVRALGACNRKEAVALLQQTAASPDPELVPIALFSLTALAAQANPAAVDALITLTAFPAQRDACVAALAGLRQIPSEPFVRGLSHPHVDVRRAVVEALARIHQPGTTDLLNTALLDAHASVRLAAIRALAQRGHAQRDDASQEPKRPALERTDPDRAVRPTAQSRMQRDS